MRNAAFCDAGILILFLSVMCSFSCWLVIQSLVSLPPAACFDLCRVCESNTSSRYTVFYNMLNEQKLIFCWYNLLLLLLCVSGSNPKKPSAPDMFTESDDMFAADFDVSI